VRARPAVGHAPGACRDGGHPQVLGPSVPFASISPAVWRRRTRRHGGAPRRPRGRRGCSRAAGSTPTATRSCRSTRSTGTRRSAGGRALGDACRRRTLAAASVCTVVPRSMLEMLQWPWRRYCV
jgi:hypothetical protein